MFALVAVVRILALLALALLPVGAFAQTKSWEIASFHVDLSVDPAGTLDVRETIALSFVGSWNGIYRWIPVVESKEGWGKKFLHLSVQEIRDDRGTALKYETSRENDYKKFKIYIPGAVNTTRVVVIAYRVSNALRYFDDHDELYWNVTGNEWPVPIRRASASITLPPGAAEGLRAVAYTGPYGARGQDHRLTISNNVVELGTTRGLAYKEGLTVAVGWPKGVVAGPSAAARAWALLLEYAIFLLPVIVFLGYFLVWYRVGRDPRLAKSVMPRYEPPGDLRPPEVGVLVDGRLDQRDISALLVDLAVRGFIKIEETKEAGWLFDTTSFTFHRKREPSEWAKLMPFEREMLQGLFGSHETSVKLADLKNRFYTHLEQIRTQTFAALKHRGYFRFRPDRVRTGANVVSLLVSGGSVVAAIVSVAALGANPLYAVVAAVLAILVAFMFSRLMPAFTLGGAQARLEVLGFEEYLGRAERDRLKLATPETFEKFLPYAMALGVEAQWAKAFEGLYTKPPDWYAGPSPVGTFTPSGFTHSLGSMAAVTASTFASSPRSSSGSSGFGGGGGGGSSGGGSGGGGGSAF